MNPVKLPTGSERNEIHGWPAPDAHCQPQHALRRHRCHQDSGWGVSVFQVALHHEAAERMGDEHRAAAQPVGRGAHIVDIVGDGTCVKALRGGAGAVPAQAQGDRAVAGTGKEVQEVMPTRRGMPAAVDEEQRHRMLLATSPLVDHLEHELIIRQYLNACAASFTLADGCAASFPLALPARLIAGLSPQAGDPHLIALRVPRRRGTPTASSPG